jgi:4a-hydroxytetrahydrobiopterin dehydratase
MALLTDEERSAFLTEHPDWEISGETLHRTFTFTDFVEAMGFVTRMAIIAEKANHHPDIDIRWNRVSIALSSHDEGGMTEKDTALALRIEKLQPIS